MPTEANNPINHQPSWFIFCYAFPHAATLPAFKEQESSFCFATMSTFNCFDVHNRSRYCKKRLSNLTMCCAAGMPQQQNEQMVAEKSFFHFISTEPRVNTAYHVRLAQPLSADVQRCRCTFLNHPALSHKSPVQQCSPAASSHTSDQGRG